MTALVETLPPRFTATDRDRIRRAYAFAARRHAGQKRKSGDPYITHLVAVAEIAVDVGFDGDTVCAALLHDVIAETGCDEAQLRAEFGDEIARLVQGITDVKRTTPSTPPGAATPDARPNTPDARYGTLAARSNPPDTRPNAPANPSGTPDARRDTHADRRRSSDTQSGQSGVPDGRSGWPPIPFGVVDERVLMLKVLDRLHNMRTIQPLDPAKRELKSRQTLDVIVPLAAHLGLDAIADELVSIARRHVPADPPRRAPADPLQRVLVASSLMLPGAFRQSYVDEWLGELDVMGSSRARARFVVGLVRGMPALSMSLRRPPGRVLAGRMLGALRWVLRSQVRTWTPLVLLLAWMTLETARSSPGDAVAILITVPPVLHAGVKRLRRALR